MSVQAFSWVIEKSQHGGSPLLVMLMIANHAHSDGRQSYPSLETLAAECRMSKRAVQYIIKKHLVPSAELIVEKRNRREGEEGLYGRNTYSIPGVVRDGFHILGAKVAPRAKKLSAIEPTLHAKRPVLHATAIATEPSLEPSLEPKTRPHTPRALSAPDSRTEKQEFNILQKIARLAREHDLNVAIHAGTGPR